jgi:hypothetical protein
MKHDRLLCAAPLRLNIPPNYDKYMEWGFFDGSVRFYSADSRKVIICIVLDKLLRCILTSTDSWSFRAFTYWAIVQYDIRRLPDIGHFRHRLCCIDMDV